MPIVYKITTTIDNSSVTSWPPQIEASEFYTNLQTKTVFADITDNVTNIHTTPNRKNGSFYHLKKKLSKVKK